MNNRHHVVAHRMTDASGKRDFLVSFDRADRAWATWIAWVLEEAGYTVFFQDWDFRGNFVDCMDRAHAQTCRTLAVLSDNYLCSDFCLAEWSARVAQDPAARQDLLVPVKVGTFTRETILSPIVHADLTACEEIQARQRLLGRVERAVGRRAKPESPPAFPGSTPREVPERPSFPYTPPSARSFQRRSLIATALVAVFILVIVVLRWNPGNALCDDDFQYLISHGKKAWTQHLPGNACSAYKEALARIKLTQLDKEKYVAAKLHQEKNEVVLCATILNEIVQGLPNCPEKM